MTRVVGSTQTQEANQFTQWPLGEAPTTQLELRRETCLAACLKDPDDVLPGSIHIGPSLRTCRAPTALDSRLTGMTMQQAGASADQLGLFARRFQGSQGWPVDTPAPKAIAPKRSHRYGGSIS